MEEARDAAPEAAPPRSRISTYAWYALFVLFLVYACTVKAASVYGAARLAREPRRSALNLAIALNARGGPGIVLASVALDAHVIAERFYVDLVLLALLTSMMAGAWLEHVVRTGTAIDDLATPADGDAAQGAKVADG